VRDAFARALWRFARLLPAFAIASLAVRAFELHAALPAGQARPVVLATVALSLLVDALALLAWLPLLFLATWPCLLPRARAARVALVGTLWSLLVLLQAGLSLYYATAGVPLGADLFAYSASEIRETAAGGSALGPGAFAAGLVPLAILWLGLAWRARTAPADPGATPSGRPARTALAAIAAAVLAAVAMQALLVPGRVADDPRLDAIRNKATFFLADSAGYAWSARAGADGASDAPVAASADGGDPVDPAYPFLHPERAPDVLGDRFAPTGGPPPNLVFIVVEGLGRSFSGPDAALGSFTPFLDELAGRSLYWRNFLASQGRTFAVFPSLFGSLPFGAQGFSALGEAMPPHDGLLSLLGGQGYDTAFYAGFDPSFDNEATFMAKAGVRTIVGPDGFGPRYRRMPGALSWGYPDDQLLARYLDGLAADPPGRPFVSVLQTISMHTPYEVPGQARWDARFERRLDELKVPEGARAGYRQYRAQYASILYTDDALRAFFDAFSKRPEYAHTVFVVTGDHRLPEIPLASRIDRYHVPLLVYSPLLREPATIGAVSSHFDVAPSLLAWLAHGYGIRTPRRATWMGKGLDMAAEFRNLHDVPLKQTKTDLRDFVSGEWFLGNGRLYALEDNLEIEPVDDAQRLASVRQRFDAFVSANAAFARERRLAPPDALRELVAYDASARKPLPAPPPATVALAVRRLEILPAAAGRPLSVRLLIANAGKGPASSPPFVPLLVTLDAQAKELGESYGKALRLAPGAVAEATLAVNPATLAPGRYFLAAFPSHPDTGHKLGAGKYHVPLDIGGESATSQADAPAGATPRAPGRP
jgi:uncharacterized sulfatase